MAKACVNMKPVNVGSCDAHLTRRKAYMNAIPEDARYTRRDLENRNEVWSFFAESVRDYYSLLCRYIKKSTGREVGGTRKMRDPKTGRMKEYSSVTPMWDMVVLIKDETTRADVQKFMLAVQERFHIQPVKAAIHRDEGHYDDENKWIPNLHAHIVWDRISKEGERAGRVIKLQKQDMAELQDMAAHTFGLERGTPKKITHKVHHERDVHIRNQQVARVKQLEKEIADLKHEKLTLTTEKTTLETSNKALSDANKVLSDANIALTDERNAKTTELSSLRQKVLKEEKRLNEVNNSNGEFIAMRLAKLFGKDDFDKKLAAADAAKTAAEAKAEQAKAEAAQTKADAATAATNSDNVVSALRREIRQMESEHEKELADVKKNHKLEMENINNQHKSELKKKDYDMRKQVADSETLADQLLARLFALFPLLEKAARAIAWMADELAGGAKYIIRGVYPRDYKAGIAILCLGQETNERRNTASRVLADMADARWNIHKNEGVVVSEWHEKILEQAYEERPRWIFDKPLTSEEPTIETDETIEKLREVFANPLPKGFTLVQPQEEEEEEQTRKQGGGLHR